MAMNNGVDLQMFLAERLHEEGTLRAGPAPGREYMVRMNLAIPLSTFQEIDKAVASLNGDAERQHRREKQNRSTLARVALSLLLVTLNGHRPSST